MANLENHKVDDDPVIKLHALCMTTKLGLQDANGKPVEAKIRKALAVRIKDEAKLNAAVKECTLEKETPGDTASNLWLCIIKKRRSNII